MGEQPNRRQVMKLGLGAALLLAWPGRGLQAAPTGTLTASAQGCCLQGEGAAALINHLSQLARQGDAGRALFESSGDERLDRATGRMLADMASKLEVRPGFAYIDDPVPNAFAMPDNWLPRTRGTVLFGRNLLRTSLARPHGDMVVMGVCAHEFAHIVQYDHRLHDRLLRNQSNNRKVELHADFLSGYYIGLRDVEYSAQQMVELGRSWEELGDNDFTDPNHHGTRQERIAASEAGYMMATQNKVGIKEAIEAGMYYLRA